MRSIVFDKNEILSKLQLNIFIIAVLGLIITFAGCGKEKEIIVQKVVGPHPVSLIYPTKDTLVTDNNPTFIWHPVSGAVRYQIQVARLSDFVLKSINTQTYDTSYTVLNPLSNSTFYWRVRGENSDSVWGDWSDADVWTFFKSDYVNYFELAAQLRTYGVPQDLFIRNDTAYVADGQACLTLVNVSNPRSPYLMSNYEPANDDFAKAVYVPPTDTFPYAFVADMRSKVEVLDIRNPIRGLTDNQIGASQFLEDLTAVVKSDTMWLLTVSSSSQCKLSYFQIIYNPFPPEIPGPVNEMTLSTDANGVYADTEYTYVANGSIGLTIAVPDWNQNNNHYIASTTALSGEALSIDVKNNYAYVACDRAGLWIVDVTNKTHPVQVTNIYSTNANYRAKDVQVIGNYVYMADAGGGLVVVDASVADSAHVVAQYPTPYAYGIWATDEVFPDGNRYIFLCDRDLGLLVFQNRISQ